MDRKPIKLKDIFCVTDGKKQITISELNTVKLNSVFINRICRQLDLSFDGCGSKANVCFANSKEVRAEFRTTFTKSDVVDYIQVMHPGRSTFTIDTEINFPENSAIFWSAIESS